MTGRLYENRINAQRLEVQSVDVSYAQKELLYKEVKPRCVANPLVGIYSVAKGGSS